ncbi:MAG TPA: hypothetical protein VGX50_15980 [Longimicrobium sp.]|jgi:hypothetical protein|nr:hypothetical protein [Longimicrobium sp.]
MRLLISSLLVTVLAACASPAPRQVPSTAEQPAPSAQPVQVAESVETATARECHDAVTHRGDASIPQTPSAVRKREGWVQVDGVVEWRSTSGETSKNAWTCDMFRGEDGVWRRRYLSFGPLNG